MFEGAVSDNFDERIEQKIFHAEIVVDSTNVSAEMKAYQPIPMIVDFKNEDELKAYSLISYELLLILKFLPLIVSPLQLHYIKLEIKLLISHN